MATQHKTLLMQPNVSYICVIAAISIVVAHVVGMHPLALLSFWINIFGLESWYGLKSTKYYKWVIGENGEQCLDITETTVNELWDMYNENPNIFSKKAAIVNVSASAKMNHALALLKFQANGDLMTYSSQKTGRQIKKPREIIECLLIDIVPKSEYIEKICYLNPSSLRCNVQIRHTLHFFMKNCYHFFNDSDVKAKIQELETEFVSQFNVPQMSDDFYGKYFSLQKQYKIFLPMIWYHISALLYALTDMLIQLEQKDNKKKDNLRRPTKAGLCRFSMRKRKNLFKSDEKRPIVIQLKKMAFACLSVFVIYDEDTEEFAFPTDKEHLEFIIELFNGGMDSIFCDQYSPGKPHPIEITDQYLPKIQSLYENLSENKNEESLSLSVSISDSDGDNREERKEERQEEIDKINFSVAELKEIKSEFDINIFEKFCEGMGYDHIKSENDIKLNVEYTQHTNDKNKYIKNEVIDEINDKINDKINDNWVLVIIRLICRIGCVWTLAVAVYYLSQFISINVGVNSLELNDYDTFTSNIPQITMVMPYSDQRVCVDQKIHMNDAMFSITNKSYDLYWFTDKNILNDKQTRIKSRDLETFINEPIAYLNLTDTQLNYPFYNGKRFYGPFRVYSLYSDWILYTQHLNILSPTSAIDAYCSYSIFSDETVGDEDITYDIDARLSQKLQMVHVKM